MNRLSMFLVCSWLVGLPTPSRAADWLGYGGPDSNFVIRQSAIKQMDPAVLWRKTFGEGTSAIVAKEDSVYFTYLRPFTEEQLAKPQDQRPHVEVVTAVNLIDGQVQWEYAYPAAWRKDQQTFGGRTRCPQSTPIIVGDYVATIGFSGLIHCLDRRSGELKWKMDAVDRFGATPVQFGFAASPVVFNDSLIFLVGGRQGGLVALDIHSGNVQWMQPCDEASYATPMVYRLRDIWQVVFVTRDDILSVDASTGKKLWSYALPKPGLTNVPTPLKSGEDKLIVSGQGLEGTRQLCLELQDGTWTVKEGWFNRQKFFYCNWLLKEGLILGCDDDLLVAIECDSGKTMGKWRGFAQSNSVLLPEFNLLLSGDGQLVSMRITDQSPEVMARYRLFEGRCWVAPTIAGNHLLARCHQEVLCLQMVCQNDGLTRLERIAVNGQTNPDESK